MAKTHLVILGLVIFLTGVCVGILKGAYLDPLGYSEVLEELENTRRMRKHDQKLLDILDNRLSNAYETIKECYATQKD